MFASRPNHITKRSQGGLAPGEHSLTETEYLFLQNLIANPPSNYEPVMTSAGEITTIDSGDIVMAKVVY